LNQVARRSGADQTKSPIINGQRKGHRKEGFWGQDPHKIEEKNGEKMVWVG